MRRLIGSRKGQETEAENKDILSTLMKIHEEDTSLHFGRDLKCQDIYVQDQTQHGMIVESMEEAVGRAAAGGFYLAKGVKCYKGSISVWGSSMFVKAPDDLHFDVAEEVLRGW